MEWREPRNSKAYLKAAGGQHELECRVCRGECQDVRREADLRARNSTEVLSFGHSGAIGNGTRKSCANFNTLYNCKNLDQKGEKCF